MRFFSGASAAQTVGKTLTNSLGMEFIPIPAGSFIMGSGADDPEALEDEKPAHRVTIGKPFHLGKYEVTQAQWDAVMEENPSRFKGRNNPVEDVSWDEAQEFIRRLNRKEGHGGYRLPTEAEWEYAARAGSTSAYGFGNDAGQLGRYAWYDGNSGKKTHPVGQKEANAWGLHDMHGNVEEWVADWYGDYSSAPATDPEGPASGSDRVFRGGSWCDAARNCRAAYRLDLTPIFRCVSLGFRLALSIEEAGAIT
jgi:formylglycine-generating enzyme required for sulfatase activity